MRPELLLVGNMVIRSPEWDGVSVREEPSEEEKYVEPRVLDEWEEYRLV